MKIRRERLIHPWSPEYSPFGQQPQTGEGTSHPPAAHDRAFLRRTRRRVRARRYRQEYHEKVLAAAAVYRQTHRDKIRASRRAHRPKEMASQQERRRALGVVPQEIISLQAREFQQIVVELRREGHSFREIARMTLRTENACRATYERYAHANGLPLRRQVVPCDDATLLATYRDGMTWAELATRLGYSGASAARHAYIRAVRHQQQNGSEASA